MKYQIPLFISIVSLIACVSACGNDDGMTDLDAGTDAGTMPCNIEPTFTSLYGNVFNTVTCSTTQCHGAPEQGGLLLDTDKDTAYQNLMDNTFDLLAAQSKRVVPMDPDSSFLWAKLNGNGTLVMPPGGKLNANCELAKIQEWINNGAPND